MVEEQEAVTLKVLNDQPFEIQHEAQHWPMLQWINR